MESMYYSNKCKEKLLKEGNYKRIIIPRQIYIKRDHHERNEEGSGRTVPHHI